MNGTWGTPPCATAGIDFTADKMDARTAAAAVEICLDCPVMVRCLAYLRHVEVAGIAGGMTLAEREGWREAQGLERSPRSAPVWATTPVQELQPADIEGLQVRTPVQGPPVDLHGKPTGDLVLLLLRWNEAGWKPAKIAKFVDRPELPRGRVARLVQRYVREGARDHTDPSPGVTPWDAKHVDDLTRDDIASLQLFVEREDRRGRTGTFTKDFVELTRRMTDEGWSAQEIADFFPGNQATAASIDYLRREVFKGSRITTMRQQRVRRARLASGLNENGTPVTTAA